VSVVEVASTLADIAAAIPIAMRLRMLLPPIEPNALPGSNITPFKLLTTGF
jgi:hypothetical protein